MIIPLVSILQMEKSGAVGNVVLLHDNVYTAPVKQEIAIYSILNYTQAHTISITSVYFHCGGDNIQATGQGGN